MGNVKSLRRTSFSRVARLAVFVGAFIGIGVLLLVISRAASPTAHFEAETATKSGGAYSGSDAAASAGQFLQFGTGAAGPTTPPSLPPPIAPAGRDFATILRSYPNGGTVVLPDGDYRVGDLSGFNPSNYLVVVAQNPGMARVVRTATALGQTDQLFNNSSKMIFVGVRFHQITTLLTGGSDIHFWYTQHSYPVTAHPFPRETHCKAGTGPVPMELEGPSNVGLYGVDIVEAGHDALKMGNNTRNITIQGVIMDKINHQGLQASNPNNKNSQCGWPGNHNYHTDSIQPYPGNVHNVLVENTYVNKVMMIQVAPGGGSISNWRINNVTTNRGPSDSCPGINARVYTSAPSGSTLQMSVTNTEVYCRDNTDWLFVTQDSRDRAMTVNGYAVRSSDRELNRMVTRRSGTVDPAQSKVKPWRDAHPYNSWRCFFDQGLPNFNNTYGSCNT